jgi:hypothetical protein
MRYYLGQCEYKWTHAGTDMETLWVRRELGEELFEQCNQDGFSLSYDRSSSTSLPGDIYCVCKIYLDIASGKDDTWFALKYSGTHYNE